MRNFLIGLLVGLVFSSGIAMGSENIKLIVNGTEIQSDVPPQIIDGRTMVPARPLAEALGATVEWDGENSTVVVTMSDNQTVQTTNYLDDWISFTELGYDLGFYVGVGERVVLRNNDTEISFLRPSATPDRTVEIITDQGSKIHLRITNGRFFSSKQELISLGLLTNN